MHYGTIILEVQILGDSISIILNERSKHKRPTFSSDAQAYAKKCSVYFVSFAGVIEISLWSFIFRRILSFAECVGRLSDIEALYGNMS